MNKSIFRRCSNRAFSLLARFAPGSTTLRPWLHRARGVAVGHGVFIGDDVYLDNEYPESIELHDGVQVSIRAVIVAHTRGPGRVIVGKNAFIGPHAVVACSGGRVLRIGAGAVIGAGCVVTRNVAPGAVLMPAAGHVVARASIPLTQARSIEEFWSGLVPVHVQRTGESKNSPPVSSGTI